jgi:hypothetical protein
VKQYSTKSKVLLSIVVVHIVEALFLLLTSLILIWANRKRWAAFYLPYMLAVVSFFESYLSSHLFLDWLTPLDITPFCCHNLHANQE